MARGKGFGEHPENINREGRPKKGETFTDIIMTELSKENVSIKTESGMSLITAKEAVVRKLISLAVHEGNFPALRYLMDRVDGSPRQMIALIGGNKEELTAEERDNLIKQYEKELAEIESTGQESIKTG